MRSRSAIMVLRHLLSILVLPFVVTVVVPRWLMHTSLPIPATIAVPEGIRITLAVIGGVLLAGGLALFAWCVALFARVGRGTLAPWDPTQRLVAVGPYRITRNPMITAVAAVLAAETLVHLSPRLALWLLLFVVINQVYFARVEEPGLERRFGEDYRRYRSTVPRWMPRVRAPRERGR